MLLRFSFQNCYSFRDETELSMVAANISDEPDFLFPARGTAHGVVPVMALYGGNAAGKSNVLAAFRFFQGQVVGSFTRREADSKIAVPTFQLDSEKREAPARLACDFVVDGVRYHYGFEVERSGFNEEWLYAWPQGRRQTWFHRMRDENSWYFGGNLRGPNRRISEFTRPNSLFLSVAAQHNHGMLKPLYEFFSSVKWSGAIPPGKPTLLFSREAPILRSENRSLVVRLLRAADVGVSDMLIVEETEGFLEFLAEMQDSPVEEEGEEVRARLADVEKRLLGGDPLYSLRLGHQGGRGQVELFDNLRESRGTISLLHHLNTVLEALQSGSILVVDELESSLHPRLCAALVGLFTDGRANRKNAQLLFTTHTDSLLQFLRRDEVALLGKDKEGVSHLTPLTDFKTKKRDDIRKGYVEGRFGGVPVLGDFGRAFEIAEAT